MLQPTMTELRQARADLQAQMQAVHDAAGDRALNSSEQGKWNRLAADVRKIDAEIADAEISEERTRNTQQARAKWGSLNIGGTDSGVWADFDVRSESPAGLVARCHDVLSRADDLSHDGREVLARAVDGRNGPAVAAMMLARANPNYESGYLKWLSNPERAFSTFTAAESQAFMALEQTRASLTTDTSTGGYTIPLSLDPSLAGIVNDGVSNPFRANATRRVAVSSPHRLITSEGATAAWTAEGAAFGDGTPAFDATDVDLHKMTVWIGATYEVLEDGGRTIRESLPLLLADARDTLENNAFTVGSGSGSPFGIVTTLAATTGSTYTATTRGSFTSASSADVLGMLAALPPRARKSGKSAWLATVGIINTIRTMTLGSDTTSMLTDLGPAGVPQLLGLPVYEASGMTSATTSGSRPLAAVDLGAYSLVEHVAGATLQYLPAMFDPTTGRPNGTAGWAYHARLGAQLVDPSQGRLLLA